MNRNEFAEELMHEPDWLRDMKDFYNKNRYYRPLDLLRLLGDPCARVTVYSDRALTKKEFLERHNIY